MVRGVRKSNCNPEMDRQGKLHGGMSSRSGSRRLGKSSLTKKEEDRHAIPGWRDDVWGCDGFRKLHIWLQMWSINYLLEVPNLIMRAIYPILKR